MKAIAFDLGASSGKMQLGTFNGATLSTETIYRFPNRQTELCGSLYWNLPGIYENLLEGIRLAGAADPAVKSIGIDTFCNDFAVLGPQGDLLTQMRCYRDPRAARCQERVYAKVSRRKLHQMTGNQCAPFNTAMQLAAMALEGEGFLLDAKNTMLLLPDLLGYFLTGEKRSEYTVSSVTQLFNCQTGGWHGEILRRLGIPHDFLPPIIPSATQLGPLTPRAADITGCAGLEVVSVCGHDTASAVAALPTNRKDAAFISSGTWSLVGVELDAPIISDLAFQWNFALEGGADKRWRLSKNVMGLWLVQECRLDYRRQGQDYSYDDLEKLARREKPFRSLIDPDDGAFYAPGGMTKKIAARCAETGQPVPESPGQMIRCIAESLALKYRWALERLEQITGRAFGRIHILGGGGQDALLDQMTASACGREVYVGPVEAALTGNLLMQLYAYGCIGSLEQGRDLVARSCRIKTFTPENTALWNQVYQTWRGLFHL